MDPNLAIVLCVVCSAGAGFGAGFFGCILSWANHEKRKNNGQHTTCSHGVAIFGAIGSTLFGVGSLVGLYFGPVTLVVVIRAGTLLPANAIFSQVFGFRPLTRDDILGTLITVSGVVCFSLFSGTPPPAPHEKEYLEMLVSSSSMICNLVLFIVFALSLGVTLVSRSTTKADTNHFVAIAVAIVSGCASAFMDVAAKGWSAVLDSGGIRVAAVSLTFWTALCINIVFLTAMRASMIYGCKRCDVLLFIPLSTVANIFYSVLAGMIVMKEYEQVISWPGLLAASVSVLGGVVMLVTGPATKDDDHPLSRGDGEGLREGEGGSALLAADDDDTRSEGSDADEDDSDTHSVTSRNEGCLAGGICQLLRNKGHELVTMNRAHYEAHKHRKRWHKVKQHFREARDGHALPRFIHTMTGGRSNKSRKSEGARFEPGAPDNGGQSDSDDGSSA